MALLKLFRAAKVHPLVLFEVRLTITDLNNRPIPHVAGRLVLGGDASWQNAGCGTRFETDADGRGVFKVKGRLHEGARKRPTSFLASLLSGKETTADLRIAAEFVYAGEPMLYVAELHRFRSDGTVLLGMVSTFSEDASGDFTIRLKQSKDGGWLLPQLGGLAITTPGHEIADFLFYPSERESEQTWILKCQFKRWPPPVLRR